VLTAVHLYADGVENFREYPLQLPGGLNFRETKAQVHEKLGAPSATGGGKKALGKIWPSWDRYDYDGYSVTVQYASGQDRVELVTLVAPVKVKSLAARR
jgi:hypothetical protein